MTKKRKPKNSTADAPSSPRETAVLAIAADSEGKVSLASPEEAEYLDNAVDLPPLNEEDGGSGVSGEGVEGSAASLEAILKDEISLPPDLFIDNVWDEEPRLASSGESDDGRQTRPDSSGSRTDAPEGRDDALSEPPEGMLMPGPETRQRASHSLAPSSVEENSHANGEDRSAEESDASPESDDQGSAGRPAPRSGTMPTGEASEAIETREAEEGSGEIIRAVAEIDVGVAAGRRTRRNGSADILPGLESLPEPEGNSLEVLLDGRIEPGSVAGEEEGEGEAPADEDRGSAALLDSGPRGNGEESTDGEESLEETIRVASSDGAPAQMEKAADPSDKDASDKDASDKDASDKETTRTAPEAADEGPARNHPVKDEDTAAEEAGGMAPPSPGAATAQEDARADDTHGFRRLLKHLDEVCGKRDIDGIRAAFGELVARFPDRGDAFVLLGTHLIRWGAHPEARGLLVEGLRRFPTCLGVYPPLIRLELHSGRVDNGRRLLSAFLRHLDGSLDAFRLGARLALELGEIQWADAIVREALKRAPEAEIELTELMRELRVRRDVIRRAAHVEYAASLSRVLMPLLGKMAEALEPLEWEVDPERRRALVQRISEQIEALYTLPAADSPLWNAAPAGDEVSAAPGLEADPVSS